MGKVTVITQPRTVGFETYEDRALGAKEVRLRTLYSGISAGTELTAYRGSNVYIHKQWDAKRRLFLPNEAPSQPYPLVGWGYEEVGEVVEVGAEVTRLKPGDVVCGTWGHRTMHVAEEGWAEARRLPQGGLDPLLGIFTHIGPIALNGVLDANIHIGETVAVFGLGVPGQIAAQLAKHSGARVIGVDLFEKRRAIAQATGAVDVALDPKEGEVAERIKDLTGGRGADVSIEVSGAAAALHEATRATAYAAKVIALGFFQGEPKGLFLGEEFHHNRIQIVCSQIGNVAPELSQRWDRIRLIQTILRLEAEGTLDLRPIITHVLPFEQAAEGYRILDEHPEEALQVVLDLREA